MNAALAALLALACAPAPGGGGGAPAKPAQRKVAMERLSDEALRACAEPGNAIALVRVERVSISAPGTRSEHVKAELAVEQALCGSPPARLVAWSFTSKGDTLLDAGRRYLVVLLAAQGYAPFGIGDHLEVAPGREAEALEQHRKALAALGAAKP